MQFPWPEPSKARAVIAARRVPSSTGIDFFEEAWRLAVEHESAQMLRVLTKRWPDASVCTPSKSPADAILGEARRLGAGAIALGWRGHGVFKRLLLGSVSHEIIRRSRWPVLVVREAPSRVRRVLLAYDDSPQARRAVKLLASATPPRGCRITVVSVVEMLQLTSLSRLPRSVQASIRSEADLENERRLNVARRKLDGAADRLRAAGWKTDCVLTGGQPLDTLLHACDDHHADVLVLGARAKTGLARALLGSVANGALTYARTPVLIVP